MRLREFSILQRDEIPSGPLLRALNRQNEGNLLEQQASKLEKSSGSAEPLPAQLLLQDGTKNTSKHGIYNNPQGFVMPKITRKKNILKLY